MSQLGHLAANAQAVASEVSYGRIGLSHHALQFQLPVARRIAFLHHATCVGQLFCQQGQLAAALHQNILIRPQLFFQALHAFLNALQVGGQCGAAGLNELLLSAHLLLNEGVVHGRFHIGVKINDRTAKLFGKQTALHGPKAQIALAHGFIICFGHRTV